MMNQKERPRAKNKELKNGVAMLNFKDFGYGRNTEDSGRENWNNIYANP